MQLKNKLKYKLNEGYINKSLQQVEKVKRMEERKFLKTWIIVK